MKIAINAQAPLQTLYGKMMIPNWPKDLICRSLRQYGEWAEAEVELLAPLVMATDVVWDVGAYVGTFSLGLARLAVPARILAIDANAQVIASLTANLYKNAPCPVRIVQTAVGETDGWLTKIEHKSDENYGSTSYAKADWSAPRTETGTIPCCRLRTLRAEHGDYDVLKLDIEGMEEDALRGDLDYLKQRQPLIWLECNEDARSLKTWATMKWLGFEPVYLAFPAFRRNNFNEQRNLIYPMAYEAALLAAPLDRLQRLKGTVVGEDIIMRPVPTLSALRQALYDTPRWSTAELAQMSRPELVARLVRLTHGKGIEEFI